MDPLTYALENLVETARFRNQWTDERIDSTYIRQLWETRRWGDAHLPRRPDREWERDRHLRKHLSLNHLDIPEEARDRLMGELEPLLGRFRQPRTGNVGNGVWLLRLGQLGMMHPTLREFAELLGIAAARIGARSVVELLRGWIDDEPLRIRKCALVEGIELFDRQPLREVNGVEMYALPPETDDFPDSFPSFGWLPLDSYRNKVVVSVEFDVTPALYAPADGEPLESSRQRQRRAPVNTDLSGARFSFDRFCEAMALSLDGYVDWVVQWDDLGDLEAFLLTPPNGPPHIKPASDSATKVIAPNNVEEFISLYAKRQPLEHVDLAVARWLKSKRRASVEDRLIELRIALEALYATGRGQIGLKVATRGAWHLGRDYDERCRYKDVLRDVYRRASAVIHADESGLDQSLADLLTSGQAICRQGLMRIVRDGIPIPSWDDIVMGKPEVQ